MSTTPRRVVEMNASADAWRHGPVDWDAIREASMAHAQTCNCDEPGCLVYLKALDAQPMRHGRAMDWVRAVASHAPVFHGTFNAQCQD